MNKMAQAIRSERDLKVLASILMNLVRIDRDRSIVHLLGDGLSESNQQAVERWLRGELWLRYRENESVDVKDLAEHLLCMLISNQDDLAPF